MMMTRRLRFEIAFASILIFFGSYDQAFGRQSAAEVRLQSNANRAKTDGKPRTVEVTTIKKTDLFNYQDFGPYTVKAYPSRTVRLYTKTSGTIRGLKLRLGDHVKQGESIAEIESAELRREIEIRELSVRRAEIALDRAKAEIRRMEKLINIKKDEHFDIKKRPETIESELGVLREELEIAKWKMEEAKIAVEDSKLSLKAARDRLASARYVAPFDGDLIEVNIQEGDRVVPTGAQSVKPAFVLGDFRFIHFSPPQGYANPPFQNDMFKSGMKAVLDLKRSARGVKDPVSTGIVEWVNPYRESTTSIQLLIIKASNPDNAVKYHDEAWAWIRTIDFKDVLTIPARASAYDEKLESTYCFVVVDGMIKKTKIETSSRGYDKDDLAAIELYRKRNSRVMGVGMGMGIGGGMVFAGGMVHEEEFQNNINEIDRIKSGLKEGDVVVVAVDSGSIGDLVDGEKVVIKPAAVKDKNDP